MHAGLLNAVNLHDGARQLLLHGRGVAHLLHELAGGHGRLIFQRLHAQVACFWNAFGGQENTCFVVLVRGHRNLASGWVHDRFKFGGSQSFHGRLLIGLTHGDHEGAIAGHVDQDVNNAKQQNGQAHQNEGHGSFYAGLLHQLLNRGQRPRGAAHARAGIDVHARGEGCQSTAGVRACAARGGKRGAARTPGG